MLDRTAQEAIDKALSTGTATYSISKSRRALILSAKAEKAEGQVLVRQAKLGVSCRVQVPVGRGVGSDSS